MPDIAKSQAEYLIRFYHPQKWFDWKQIWKDEDLAPLYNIDPDTYRGIREKLAGQVKQAAEELKNDPAFMQNFEALAFRDGEKIFALGASLTDDALSWFEILRVLFDGYRKVECVNAALSGQSSTRVLAKIAEVLRQAPDRIFVFTGTNDARRHGPPFTKCLVSIEETEKNFQAMQALARVQCPQAEWTWITPPPVLENKFRDSFLSKQNAVIWKNEDLQAVRRVIRKQPGNCVDLEDALGEPPEEKYYMADGLHPSLAGQVKILRAMIDALAG